MIVFTELSFLLYVQLILPKLLDVTCTNAFIRHNRYLKHLRVLKLLWSIVLVWRRLLYAYELSLYLNPIFERYGVALMRRQHYAAGERLQLHIPAARDTSYKSMSDSTKRTSSSSHPSIAPVTSLYSTDNIRSLCLFAFVVGIKLVELYAQHQRRQAQEIVVVANSGCISNILDDFLLDDDGNYSGDSITSDHKPTQPSLHQLLVKSKGVLAPPRPPPSHTHTELSLGASSGQSSGVVLVDPLEDKRLCPLCGKERVSPCVSTGGYVFCYLCLLDHLTLRPWLPSTAGADIVAARDSNSGDAVEGELLSYCPVSGVPCRVSDMIRLYKEW